MASSSFVRGGLAVAAGMVLVASATLAQQVRVPGQMPNPSKEPPLVTAGAAPGVPPSDAIVLFDGKDLS
jgi:hypothetical protein